MTPPTFHRLGPAVPRTPVVIAVPHAGRTYPAAMADAVRVSLDRLVTLEDRHAQQLVEGAVADGATVIVADVARAWIDLNRHPRDIDPAMVTPPPPVAGLSDSPRIRAGLGLIPRRLPGTGEIWRSRIAADDIRERVASVHAPYHRCIADALAAARAEHGWAVLLDCHSMPPLTGESRNVEIVFGDLDGRSAERALFDAAVLFGVDRGFRTARNRPYAGGYTLAEHGRPHDRVHALQLEVSRTLYLDGALRQPGPGLGRMQQFVAGLYRVLAAPRAVHLLAAE